MSRENKKIIILSGLIMAFSLILWHPFFGVEASDEVSITKDELKSVSEEIKKEQANLEKEKANLNKVQSSVYNVRSEINKTEGMIKNAEITINKTASEIDVLNLKIKEKKILIVGLMQEIYYSSQEPFIFRILRRENFNKSSASLDYLINVKTKISQLLRDIEISKERIEKNKDSLEEKRNEHEQLLNMKSIQEKQLLTKKNIVEGNVQEKEATISELRQKLLELQADLRVLTGDSYNAKDVQDAVEFASKATGVPKGVLYAFLQRETSLGANTGQCTYDYVKKTTIPEYERLLKTNKNWQYSIDRLLKRKKLFEGIVEELEYDKSKKVSCTLLPFSRYGPNQGGAMGVAQFMSDVWLSDALQKEIIAKTGHKHPNPWDLTDGVMAMAIKLRNVGATSDSKTAIRNAVVNYYGVFDQNYYDSVIYWSKNYERLFQ